MPGETKPRTATTPPAAAWSRVAWWPIIRRAAQRWWRQRAQAAGAIAFATVFAIAPLLLIALAAVGWLYGEAAAREQLQAELTSTLGVEGANLVGEWIKRRKPADNAWAATVGVVVALWAASTLSLRLHDAVNQVWDGAVRTRTFWSGMLRQFLAMLLIIASGCLVLLSLVASVWVGVLTGPVAEHFGGVMLVQLADAVLSLVLHTLLLVLLLKFLPDTDISWRAVWIGAAMTAVLLHLGKVAFGLYLSHAGLKALYGAAASIIVLMLWTYYSAQVFLLGVEITRAANEIGEARAGALASATSEG